MLLFIGQACSKTEPQIQRINYSEKSFIDFFEEVEACRGNKGIINSYYIKPKGETHLYAHAGGTYSDNYGSVIAQVIVRFLTSSISKKTSLNAGLSYTNDREFIIYQYGFGVTRNYTRYRSMIEIPVTMQYNVLTGIIQPYFNGGFSILYFDRTPHPEPLFRKNKSKGAGISYIIALGIESTIVKKLLLKVDWRIDFSIAAHLPTVSIGYWFK